MNYSSNSCNQIRKSKIIFDITPTQKKDIHSRAYSTEMIILGLKNLLTSFTLANMSATNRPAYLKTTFYLLSLTLERSNGLTVSSAAQIRSFNCSNCLIFLLYLCILKTPVTCKGRQIFFAKLLQATKHLCLL